MESREPNMGHTFSRILLHVVFSTKDRKNLLSRQLRERLLPYLCEAAQRENARIATINAVDNHVHFLLEIRPSHAPAELMRKLKSNSSKWIHEEFPNLRAFQWQSGYGVFSVSESSADAVAEYIRNQEVRHKTLPFAEEMGLFLEKHKIDFDPDHYLD